MRFLAHIRTLAALSLPFVLSSLPSLAEEAEGEGGGMPQMDLAFFPEQIFWLVVTFATLYALMAFIALPRISKSQSNRKRVISAEIKVAREANDAAKAAVASMDKALAEARENAQSKVGEMLAHVAAEANEHQAAKEKELLRKLHRAEEDIAVSREAAMQQVRDSASELAEVIVGKILGPKGRARA